MLRDYISGWNVFLGLKTSGFTEGCDCMLASFIHISLWQQYWRVQGLIQGLIWWHPTSRKNSDTFYDCTLVVDLLYNITFSLKKTHAKSVLATSWSQKNIEKHMHEIVSSFPLTTYTVLGADPGTERRELPIFCQNSCTPQPASYML